MSATRRPPVDYACKNCNASLLAVHYQNKTVMGLLSDLAVRTGGEVRLHDHGTKPVSVIWHWRPRALEYAQIDYGHTAQEALERALEFLDDMAEEGPK